MTNLPIELWHIVINPTFFYPKLYIRIEVIVVLQSVGFASIWSASFVSVNTKWTNTKSNPWLCSGNGHFHLLYKQIDIVAAPISSLICCKSLRCSITIEAIIIRKRTASNGVWIKIIIHVNGIYIIA